MRPVSKESSSLLKERLNARSNALSSSDAGTQEPKEFKKDLKKLAHKVNTREPEVQEQEPDYEQEQPNRLKRLKEKNNPDPEITNEEYEDRLEQEELVREFKEAKKSKRAASAAKFFTVVFVIGCIYLVFLIYGAINTNYIYDRAGNVIPLSMNMNTLKGKRDFESIAVQYLQARTLYEQILVLDYRMAAGLEDPLLIGPEYDKILNDVESLTLQLNELAQRCPSEYNQVVSMLRAWVGTDVAVYCQNMSAAIAQNNAVYADNALQYKDMVYVDFSLITKNLSTLGANVDGSESIVMDILDWSPEKYLQESVGYVE